MTHAELLFPWVLLLIGCGYSLAVFVKNVTGLECCSSFMSYSLATIFMVYLLAFYAFTAWIIYMDLFR